MHAPLSSIDKFFFFDETPGIDRNQWYPLNHDTLEAYEVTGKTYLLPALISW